jgi:HAD superfamily hydrolase (TIGR01549 family)
MTAPLDWAGVKLVVFDLDGTLYDQRAVRLAMAGDLLVHCAKTRSLRDLRLVSAYRKLREQLAEDGAEDFEGELHARLGASHGIAPHEVAAKSEEWLERRPLRRLLRARIAGADALFTALRRSGRRVGVWSDYPVVHKLASLELEADFICAATDPEIRRLKPDPAGLLRMMSQAEVEPHETLMIGDRPERDGVAAERAGVHFLLRTRRPVAQHRCAADFRDPLFASVLAC